MLIVVSHEQIAVWTLSSQSLGPLRVKDNFERILTQSAKVYKESKVDKCTNDKRLIRQRVIMFSQYYMQSDISYRFSSSITNDETRQIYTIRKLPFC